MRAKATGLGHKEDRSEAVTDYTFYNNTHTHIYNMLCPSRYVLLKDRCIRAPSRASVCQSARRGGNICWVQLELSDQLALAVGERRGEFHGVAPQVAGLPLHDGRRAPVELGPLAQAGNAHELARRERKRRLLELGLIVD